MTHCSKTEFSVKWNVGRPKLDGLIKEGLLRTERVGKRDFIIIDNDVEIDHALAYKHRSPSDWSRSGSVNYVQYDENDEQQSVHPVISKAGDRRPPNGNPYTGIKDEEICGLDLIWLGDPVRWSKEYPGCRFPTELVKRLREKDILW